MKPPVRVLYVAHTAGSGGAFLSLRSLVEALDRSRFEPVVAFLHDVPGVPEAFRERGIAAFRERHVASFPHTTGGWNPLTTPAGALRALRSLRGFTPSARRAEEIVRRERPDIVHLNSLVLAPFAAGARAAGARVVWHVRESVHPGHLGVRRRWLGSALRRWSDEAIFISEDDRRRLTGGRYGVVVPNFVDPRRFDRALDGAPVRAELGIPAEVPLVVFFGGVSRLKGGEVLLRALARVRPAVPGMHAIVAGAEAPWSTALAARAARAVLPLLGTGTERQRFLRVHREEGMEGWTHLLPYRTDPERLIAAADLVVFPSTAPHFARPVIEAGSMAKPVVASRLGGVEELVEDGVTGVLAAPGDPEALAAAIASVLRDPARARAMGAAGHARAAERYSLDRNVGRIVESYARVLAR